MARVFWKADFWVGVALIAIGFVVLIAGSEYSMGALTRPGPGFFPKGLALIALAIGLFSLMRSLTGSRDEIEPIGLRPMIVLVAALLFGILISRAGLVITLAVTVSVGALAVTNYRYREIVVLVSVLEILMVAIFVWGLAVPIPLWPRL